ncbi:MAG: hypothetical protein IIC92_07560, partial [Chloroflexi bacterium]|nr:hypothetical protein [Chloroflexota bacterium]
MGARSEIYEAVAAAPVRKTMIFAAALLGLLVIFGASGDTVFAKGRPAADSASATLVQVDRGDFVLSPIPGINNEVFIGSFGGNGIDGMPNGSQIRADQSSRFVPSPTEENPDG